MNDELTTAFDECLNALAAGEDLEASLKRYPALADELRPMLKTARAAQLLGGSFPAPRQAQLASRAKFLARAGELRAVQRPRTWRDRLTVWLFSNRLASAALAILLVTVIGGYSALTVSAQSLPGDPLYGLKRTVEQTQLWLSPNAQSRAELEYQFTSRRLDEVEQVMAEGRTVDVEFGGVLDGREGERWSMGGLTVVVPAGTPIAGTPVLGVYVKVFGQSQADGTVLATRVEVQGEQFTGLVRVIGAQTWQIDDRIVRVGPETQIVGNPQVGDEVEVHTHTLSDGQSLALLIALTRTGLSPTATLVAPSATPEPSAISPTEIAATSPASTPTLGATLTPDATDDGDEEIEFTGVVESIGAASWLIGGQVVQVTASTEIRDNPQVGQLVEVRAIRDAGGALIALRIELESSGPSPSNTPGGGGSTPPPTGAPTGTPGDDETETPEPTETDDDYGDDGSGGPGPSPSNTPQPPDPSESPEPSETDEPDEERFEGIVQSINGGIWVVGGVTVITTGSTDIRDNPQVGDNVEVRGFPQTDGSWIATRIEKK
jgi:hypothetical protein